jgi:hypothetical protein
MGGHGASSAAVGEQPIAPMDSVLAQSLLFSFPDSIRAQAMLPGGGGGAGLDAVRESIGESLSSGPAGGDDTSDEEGMTGPNGSRGALATSSGAAATAAFTGQLRALRSSFDADMRGPGGGGAGEAGKRPRGASNVLSQGMGMGGGGQRGESFDFAAGHAIGGNDRTNSSSSGMGGGGSSFDYGSGLGMGMGMGFGGRGRGRGRGGGAQDLPSGRRSLWGSLQRGWQRRSADLVFRLTVPRPPTRNGRIADLLLSRLRRISRSRPHARTSAFGHRR